MKEQQDKVFSKSNPNPLSINWHLFGLINTRSLCVSLSAFQQYNLLFLRDDVIVPLRRTRPRRDTFSMLSCVLILILKLQRVLWKIFLMLILHPGICIHANNGRAPLSCYSCFSVLFPWCNVHCSQCRDSTRRQGSRPPEGKTSSATIYKNGLKC